MHFYGKGIPGVDPESLTGHLIVIEGGDGAGRSTQMQLLSKWLDLQGHPTIQVEFKRSLLVGEELETAMQGNQLCYCTLGLFYATDFVDQLERTIIPALRAGFVVLADRYIYTLIARDIVRGSDPAWVKNVYGPALIPHLTVYLKVSPKILAQRSLLKDGSLDFWESGMDIQRSGDIYDCFVWYQNQVQHEFQKLQTEYGIQLVNGNRSPQSVHAEIRKFVETIIVPRAATADEAVPDEGKENAVVDAECRDK